MEESDEALSTGDVSAVTDVAEKARLLAGQKRDGINDPGFGDRWHEHDRPVDASQHPNEPQLSKSVGLPRSTSLVVSALELVDEEAARTFLERFRWPNEPVCPHCGLAGGYPLHPKPDSTKPVRKGVFKCRGCRKQFTVTVGTRLANSHIPLNKWLLAIRQLCESEKPVSAYQLHRLVGVSRQSASRIVQRVSSALAPTLRIQAPRRRGARRP
jgi:transposase-like protein